VGVVQQVGTIKWYRIGLLLLLWVCHHAMRPVPELLWAILFSLKKQFELRNFTAIWLQLGTALGLKRLREDSKKPKQSLRNCQLCRLSDCVASVQLPPPAGQSWQINKLPNVREI